MAGEITLNQMLQPPVIKKSIAQIKTPLKAFQQHFNLGPGSAATETTPTGVISWDIFNPTRTLAKVRPRNSGPPRSSEKPIGSNTANLVRTHDSIHIEQGKVYGTRDLGKGFDTPLDIPGAKYIERQLGFLKQKFANAREFMISRMFRNGFGVAIDGEDMNFVEADDATAFFTVDYKIPATNRGANATMGAAAGIFGDPWDNPATDIPGQLYAARKAMIRLNGMELTEFWINSSTFAVMQKNQWLAQVAGSANTVFESITGQGIKKEETDAADGFVVMFKALPKFKFFVYDGVLNVNTGDSTSEDDSSLFIPDGYMIGTPRPDTNWLGSAEGSEIVAESYVDPGKNVTGMHFWKNRTILPPGWDLIGVDNFLPILYVPTAVIYVQVYDASAE